MLETTGEATKKLGLTKFKRTVCSDEQIKKIGYTSEATKKLGLTIFRENGLF